LTPSWESLPVEQLPTRNPCVTGPVKGVKSFRLSKGLWIESLLQGIHECC
jgi:hypothetical protein